jgi:hypothetical protein
MRQINYDYDPVTDRLQRILEVAEFTKHHRETKWNDAQI